MQITMKTTVFDRVVEALSDFAISFANARLAAEEIERLHKMSDEELALHNVAREDIAAHVYKRYLK